MDFTCRRYAESFEDNKQNIPLARAFYYCPKFDILLSKVILEGFVTKISMAINATDNKLQCIISHVPGVFTNGGTQANIIPDSAALEFTVRTPTKKELEVLKEKVIGCFEGAARATGCTVPIQLLVVVVSTWSLKPILTGEC